MSATTLPIDEYKPGYHWCEHCKKSISAARVTGHLVSKKHVAASGGACDASGSEEDDETAAADSESKRSRAKKTTPSADARKPKPKKDPEDRPSKPKKDTREEVPAAEKAKSKPRPKKEPEPEAKDEDTSASASRAAPKAKKTAAVPTSESIGGLIADPQKAGYYWCGICEKSLNAQHAVGHRETATHNANVDKTLSSAMRRTRLE